MEVVGQVLRYGGGFVPAFVLTWLIESAVYLVAFRSLALFASGPTRLTVSRALLLTLLVNLATHPLLWLFLSAAPGLGPLLLAECVAVLVEGTILGWVLRGRLLGAHPWSWAYLAALLANAVSLLVGLTVLAGPLKVLGAAGSSACC